MLNIPQKRLLTHSPPKTPSTCQICLTWVQKIPSKIKTKYSLNSTQLSQTTEQSHNSKGNQNSPNHGDRVQVTILPVQFTLLFESSRQGKGRKKQKQNISPLTFLSFVTHHTTSPPTETCIIPFSELGDSTTLQEIPAKDRTQKALQVSLLFNIIQIKGVSSQI